MPPVLTTEPPRLATAESDAGRRPGTTHFRRGVVLMLMTLVLPGSAQLAAGRRSVGRIAVRTWLALIGVCVALFLVGLVFRGFAFWLLTSSAFLDVVRLVLMALAIGWAGLFIDAWRIANPLAMERRQRLAMVGINGVLCFAVAGTLLFASHVVGVQKDFLGRMFGSGKASAATQGRYNVLLLGGDSGADRWGLRPDSISVASIDAGTGKAVLFGLPRNMLNFPFAKDSIMAKAFPKGYDCGSQCELNSLATWAADNQSLFKGVRNPGVEATTEAVEGITGLKINYYAMVNLQGFQKLVDAVGGVKLRVRDPIPIGGIGSPVTGYIKPGYRKLNGFKTLWFARSRVAADDYSRMARQKCVMSAMLQQLSPRTVVLKFDKIAKASTALLTTNLPRSEVDTFAQLALKARSQPIRTVSFVPPMIDTSNPDIGKIQAAVKRAITVSDGSPKGGAQAGKAARKRTTHVPGTTNGGGSIGTLKQGYAANQAADLSAAC